MTKFNNPAREGSGITLFAKQSEAIEILYKPQITELLYGGAAGGAKTFLGCYWQLKNRLMYAGTRGLIGRAKLKTLRMTTLKTLFDVAAKMGLILGEDFTYQATEGLIKFNNGSEILFKDLFLYPSDPEFVSLGGLEITDAFIDEAGDITEKAFLMVNSRIRYKLNTYGLKPKMLLTCNPSLNWLYHRFYKLSTKNALPAYRAFIAANLDDNEDLGFRDLYKEQLSKLDETGRRRLLLGEWEFSEDLTSMFSGDNIKRFFNNPRPANIDELPPYISADISQFGDDTTVVILWLGKHIQELHLFRKQSVADTKSFIASLAAKNKVPEGHVVIDADGIGGADTGKLRYALAFHGGAPEVLMPYLKPYNKPYKNLRAQCYFLLSEAIALGKLSIEPNVLYQLYNETYSIEEALSQDLRSIKVDLQMFEGKRSVLAKKEIIASLSRSPDLADALMMRMYLELKRHIIEHKFYN